MHEPTTFTEPTSGFLRTDTVVQPRLVLVATTFLVLGFLLGACADQYKTFAGAYSDVIDIYRSSVVLAPLHLGAETVARPGAGMIAPSNAGARLTGKERLGEKWKDEQRVDNCKVPLDKQGPKRRPDSC
jgi:hypothetical protein